MNPVIRECPADGVKSEECVNHSYPNMELHLDRCLQERSMGAAGPLYKKSFRNHEKRKPYRACEKVSVNKDLCGLL